MTRTPTSLHFHDDAPSTTRRALGYAGGLILGGVLLIAAYAKLLDPGALVEQIRLEHLDGLLSAEAMAFLALGCEVALGVALVLGVRRLWVMIPASLLVVFFVFLTGRTYWLDRHGLLEATGSCGCFGNLVDRTPAQAFWQDFLLLVPTLGLAWQGRSRDEPFFPPVRTLVVGVMTVAALVFAHEAPRLPLDDLATRLKPGVEVADLCAGTEDNRVCLNLIVPELATGRHVVVMADLGDGDEGDTASADSGAQPDAQPGAQPAAHGDTSFGELVPELNAYALQGTGPRLWVVGEITPEKQNELFWQWGPAFEIRAAPMTLLRPLYRRLPRSFLVEDGEVTETYRGLPPLAKLARSGAAGDADTEAVQADAGSGAQDPT